jgi:hypothetical protein
MVVSFLEAGDRAGLEDREGPVGAQGQGFANEVSRGGPERGGLEADRRRIRRPP